MMEVDMDTSPGHFDPEDLSSREKFRRYGKRPPGSSLSPHHDNSTSRFSNAVLFLENIKHEVESFDRNYDSHGIFEDDVGGDATRRRGKQIAEALQARSG